MCLSIAEIQIMMLFYKGLFSTEGSRFEIFFPLVHFFLFSEVQIFNCLGSSYIRCPKTVIFLQSKAALTKFFIMLKTFFFFNILNFTTC